MTPPETPPATPGETAETRLPFGETPVSQPLPLRIDGYSIEGLLGRGTSGIVYLARQSRPARRVALKVLLGTQQTDLGLYRFEREVALMGSIEHPNIARLYGTGMFRDAGFEYPYLVMEHVRGLALVDHADARQLSRADRLSLLATVARAVHFMHTRGVVHRDLKPQNILVDDSGVPKLLDFGVARTRNNADDTLLTRQGDLVGTLPYMAPEQIEGNVAQIDLQVDVYALGVIGHELVLGRLPYHAEAFRTLITAAQTLRQRPPERALEGSALPRDLRMVLSKALHGDRTLRYGSALELALDLERFLHHEPVQAQAPGLWHGLRLFARRRAALATALGVSLASMMLAVVVSVHFAMGEAAARQQEKVARAKAESRARELEATNAFVDAVLVGADPVNSKGAALTMREVVTSAAHELETHPPQNAAVAIRAGIEIGDALVNMHEMATGVAVLERAAALARQTPDLDPMLQASALYDEASTLVIYDFTGAAERKLRPLLSLPLDDPSDNGKLWVDIRLSLAQALLQEGRAREAAPLLDLVEDRQRRGLAADSPDVQYITQTRITMEYLLGHYQALIDRQAREDAEVARTNGAGSVVRQTLFHAAALSALELDQLPLAQHLMEAWVQLAVQQFGADQQNTLEAQSKLAYIQHLQHPKDGLLVARLGTLYEALRQKPRSEPVMLAVTRINLGAALLHGDAHQRAEGETVLRSVLADVDARRLPDNLTTARAGLLLAQYLRGAARAAQADALYDRVCHKLEAKVDAGHPYLRRCRAGQRSAQVVDLQR